MRGSPRTTRAAIALALAACALAPRAAAAGDDDLDLESDDDEAKPAAPAQASPPPKPAPNPAGPPLPDPNAPYPPASPRVVPLPDTGYTYAQPQYYPSLAWWATQLVPSPEIAIGTYRDIGLDGVAQTRTASSFGLRWQVTPVLWSWGTNRHSTRWRFFVVDPLARHAGSIELNTSFDWFFGHADRVLARPGVRATFPVLSRGEYLSVSLGTSIYRYDDMLRLAYDGGIYTLSGIVGLLVTVAPANGPLATIATLNLRYF